MKFTEENMMNSYYNPEDGTCDLEFNDGVETAWIRNAPFMEETEVDEYYWTDETIQYALKNGATIEEA